MHEMYELTLEDKSAEAVIYGLIGKNDGMKKEIKRLVAENRRLKE